MPKVVLTFGNAGQQVAPFSTWAERFKLCRIWSREVAQRIPCRPKRLFLPKKIGFDGIWFGVRRLGEAKLSTFARSDERDYVRTASIREVLAHVRNGLSLRMSSAEHPEVGPSLIRASAISVTVI